MSLELAIVFHMWMNFMAYKAILKSHVLIRVFKMIRLQMLNFIVFTLNVKLKENGIVKDVAISENTLPKWFAMFRSKNLIWNTYSIPSGQRLLFIPRSKSRSHAPGQRIEIVQVSHKASVRESL